MPAHHCAGQGRDELPELRFGEQPMGLRAHIYTEAIARAIRATVSSSSGASMTLPSAVASYAPVRRGDHVRSVTRRRLQRAWRPHQPATARALARGSGWCSAAIISIAAIPTRAGSLKSGLDFFQHFPLENTPGDACQVSLHTPPIETIIYSGSYFNVVVRNDHAEENASPWLSVCQWIS